LADGLSAAFSAGFSAGWATGLTGTTTAGAGAGAGVASAGGASDAVGAAATGVKGETAGWAGIRMGKSTEIGRGWVSNTMGKPTTATTTKRDAPIKRWRDWRRTSSRFGGELPVLGDAFFNMVRF
jgi:hypothetical protein